MAGKFIDSTRCLLKTAPWAALGLGLLAASGCSSQSDLPEFYDHGLRAPKPYNPSIIPGGPSHSLPSDDPTADALAATGGEIRINATGKVHAAYTAGSGTGTSTGEQTWTFRACSTYRSLSYRIRTRLSRSAPFKSRTRRVCHS